MSSIFSKIIKGDIPSYKIDENDNCYAFLDISPLAAGHTLVVPKVEKDYLFDLDNELYTDLFLFAKKIAQAIQKATDCKKIGMAVIGFDVNHAHIHLVPLNHTEELNFFKEKLTLNEEEFKDIANKIRNNL